MIRVAEANPSFAPSMNTSYTLTRRTTPIVSMPRINIGMIHALAGLTKNTVTTRVANPAAMATSGIRSSQLSFTACTSGGEGAGNSREKPLAASTATTVLKTLATSVGTKIDSGAADPAAARIAITPVGSTATPDVLIARKSTIAFVAVPGCLLSVSSSCIALMPNGVAALPRPSTLAPMFMTIAPIAGCVGGTSGNRRTSTGRMSRARASSPPAASTTFISPRNSVIAPARVIASVTLALAPSNAAVPTAAIFVGSAPDTAATMSVPPAQTTAASTSTKKTMFIRPV